MDPITLSIMAALAIATQVAGGVMSANAARAEGAQAAHNARLQGLLANRQAMDAVSRGNYEAGLHRMKGSFAVGAQRAAAGASGVDSSSGTAADVYGDTRAMAELDALTTANNAMREAWGYKVQASQAGEAARIARQRADAAATGHLVQAGIGAAGTAANFAGKLGAPSTAPGKP